MLWVTYLSWHQFNLTSHIPPKVQIFTASVTNQYITLEFVDTR